MSAEAAVLAAGEDLRVSLASVVAAVLDTTPVSLAPEYAVSGDDLALASSFRSGVTSPGP